LKEVVAPLEKKKTTMLSMALSQFALEKKRKELYVFFIKKKQ
jgi:hypothetical protein